MRKHRTSSLILLFILVFSLFGGILSSTDVKAATISTTGLTANDATITDSSGKTVSNTEDLDKYSSYKVS